MSIHDFRKHPDPYISAVARMMQATDWEGRVRAQGAVEMALTMYVPAIKTEKAQIINFSRYKRSRIAGKKIA